MQRITPPLYIVQIFGALFLLCYALGLPVIDSDTAWHLAAGDLIRSSGQIIHLNTWSYTTPTHEWINVSWAWDILISFLMQHTGAKGVFMFLCSLYAATGTFIAYSLHSRGTFRPEAIYATIGIIILVFTIYQWARPQTATLLLVAVFHHLLHVSRKDDRHILLLWLPLLTALWVNMHGGYVMAFMLLGFYGIDALRAREVPRFKALVLSGVLCLVASFLNPWGWKLWLSVYQNSISVMTPFIQEWQTYRFNSSSFIDLFLIMLLLTIDLRDRKLPLADKLCLLFVLAALMSQRLFIVAVIVSAPALAAGMTLWAGKKKQVKLVTKRSASAVFVAAGIWAVLAVVPMHAWLGRDLEINPKYAAKEEIAFIRAHYPGAKVHNEYGLGGYLIYFNEGRNQVFVDGRAVTAYPDAFLALQPDILNYKFEALVKQVRQHRPDLVLFSNAYLAQYEEGRILREWKPVFKGPVATVFRPR